ncbi:hypothetical protein [Brevibacterium litoralis]|uniref:hypothetical protein n=1 Tax=Brevibacterium litoralis TaxID=3138935 RepID=UPI0032EF4FD0
MSAHHARRCVPAGLLALATLAGCVPLDTTGARETPPAATPAAEAPAPVVGTAGTPSFPDRADETGSAVASDSALLQLAELEVKGRAPKTGYDRDLFSWREDVDHNGCDTRNDVLRRDLTEIVLREDGCVVEDGVLADPYTGETFDFVYGSGTNVQIDHVVDVMS